LLLLLLQLRLLHVLRRRQLREWTQRRHGSNAGSQV
jgi:hypothetical protein